MTSLFLITCIVLLLIYHDTPIVDAVEYGESTTCPEVPSLHCKNGSTCTPGMASFDAKHGHMATLLQTHDSGYHCKCVNGYIGHECEILVRECSGNAGHVCYNGAECASSNSCNCDALNESSGSTDAKYTGDMCQHVSTSFCAVTLVGNHAPNHQFCTNHGVCARLVSGREPHPGCVCKDSWRGDHCEVRGDVFGVPSSSNSRGNVKTLSNTMLGIMILAIVAVTSSIVYVLARNRRILNAALREENQNCLEESPASEPIAASSITTTRTTSRKTVIGEGDLDADGSGTLASPSKARGDDAMEDESIVSDNERNIV